MELCISSAKERVHLVGIVPLEVEYGIKQGGYGRVNERMICFRKQILKIHYNK